MLVRLLYEIVDNWGGLGYIEIRWYTFTLQLTFGLRITYSLGRDYLIACIKGNNTDGVSCFEILVEDVVGEYP